MNCQTNFKKFPWYILIIICLTIFFPSILYASVYYVATTGEDSNSGTKISPFKTIKKGVTVLSAGDTLYVKSGTYKETIVSWDTAVSHGTSWDNPITIAAFPGDTVTIEAPRGRAAVWIKDPTVKYLIIDGFIMDGKRGALHGVKLQGGQPTHIRVQNSEIKNSVYSAVLASGCKSCNRSAPLDTHYEFINLHVHHNGSSIKDHGFYIATGRNLIEHCHIHHNAANGGKFFNAYRNPDNSPSTAARYNVIRYSTIHDNSQKPFYPDNPEKISKARGWILASGEGNEAYGNVSYNQPYGLTIGYGAKNALMYNNIVYNNTETGINVHGAWGGSTGAKVFNNTVYNNGNYGISVSLDAKNTSVKNNIAFKNGSATSKNIWIDTARAPGTEQSSNLLTNPRFIDVKARNFALQPGSVAIDAGLPLPEVTKDFLGVERSQGNAYDIGAIEQEAMVDTDSPKTPINVVIVN